MMKNHIYNLMEQLVQESKSLWRIKNNYMDDNEDCDECRDFWQKMIEDKESHIEELEGMIKNHLN